MDYLYRAQVYLSLPTTTHLPASHLVWDYNSNTNKPVSTTPNLYRGRLPASSFLTRKLHHRTSKMEIWTSWATLTGAWSLDHLAKLPVLHMKHENIWNIWKQTLIWSKVWEQRTVGYRPHFLFENGIWGLGLTLLKKILFIPFSLRSTQCTVETIQHCHQQWY